jgi:hypothetical protein
MALSKITYTDKETLNPLPSVADKNKVTDDDMNEIKSVVNSAIDQVEANTIPQQATAPVSPSENDLWIDTDEPGVINIDSTPSTSSTNPIENQAITNYVKNLIKIETISINAGSYNGVSENYDQIYNLTNIPTGYKFAGIVGYNMYGNNFTQCVVVQLHKYSDTQIEWGLRCWSSGNTGPITLYVDVLYIKE